MFYNTLLLCVIAEKRQMKRFYKRVDGPLKTRQPHIIELQDRSI